jgi:hypothetical protein
MLGVLRRIAQRVREDEGEGVVPGVIQAALKRLIAFEIQVNPPGSARGGTRHELNRNV